MEIICGYRYVPSVGCFYFLQITPKIYNYNSISCLWKVGIMTATIGYLSFFLIKLKRSRRSDRNLWGFIV